MAEPFGHLVSQQRADVLHPRDRGVAALGTAAAAAGDGGLGEVDVEHDPGTQLRRIDVTQRLGEGGLGEVGVGDAVEQQLEQLAEDARGCDSGDQQAGAHPLRASGDCAERRVMKSERDRDAQP